MLLMSHWMAAGFCILRNNNNYYTRHNLSSKSANASAAGYFDTLNEKLFRANVVQWNILILCLSVPFLLAIALSTVFILINKAAPVLWPFCKWARRKSSVWVLHESGKDQSKGTQLWSLGPRWPDMESYGSQFNMNGFSDSHKWQWPSADFWIATMSQILGKDLGDCDMHGQSLIIKPSPEYNSLTIGTIPHSTLHKVGSQHIIFEVFVSYSNLLKTFQI